MYNQFKTCPSPDPTVARGHNHSSSSSSRHIVLLYLFSFASSVFLTYTIWCLFQLEVKLVQTGSESDQLRIQLAFSNAQLSDQAGRIVKIEAWTRRLEARLDMLETEAGNKLRPKHCEYIKPIWLYFSTSHAYIHKRGCSALHSNNSRRVLAWVRKGVSVLRHSITLF